MRIASAVPFSSFSAHVTRLRTRTHRGLEALRTRIAAATWRTPSLFYTLRACISLRPRPRWKASSSRSTVVHELYSNYYFLHNKRPV